MIRGILYSLPLSSKILLGKMKSFTNIKKIQAMRNIVVKNDDQFKNLNSNGYKKNLCEFLKASFYNATETQEYIEYLYEDKVTLVSNGKFEKNNPTIICVVKNEIDKLGIFFQHYKRIGEFNYIFIDNGSTDDTCKFIIENGATLYSCHSSFSTNRKVAWINKVYSTIPEGCWTILLDADELLVFDGYEDKSINEVLTSFEKNGITCGGAIMIDMFSTKPVSKEEYISKYVYFENRFHEERSYYFNSVYGGIREREFKHGRDRMFLIKKHPVIRKTVNTMLVHCHYNYPFIRNMDSKIYFGLLHYKLFDSEIEKYKNIAKEGNYENGSNEYKSYLSIMNNKEYEEIFYESENTVEYKGTESLIKINCLRDVREIYYE